MAEKDRLRNKQIRIWVSENELKAAADKADNCKLNMSEFIRELISNGAVINYSPFEMKEVCNEINKIGTNINQIAHRVNEFSTISNDDFDNLKKAYEDLFDLYVEKVMGE